MDNLQELITSWAPTVFTFLILVIVFRIWVNLKQRQQPDGLIMDPPATIPATPEKPSDNQSEGENVNKQTSKDPSQVTNPPKSLDDQVEEILPEKSANGLSETEKAGSEPPESTALSNDAADLTPSEAQASDESEEANGEAELSSSEVQSSTEIEKENDSANLALDSPANPASAGAEKASDEADLSFSIEGANCEGKEVIDPSDSARGAPEDRNASETSDVIDLSDLEQDSPLEPNPPGKTSVAVDLACSEEPCTVDSTSQSTDNHLSPQKKLDSESFAILTQLDKEYHADHKRQQDAQQIYRHWKRYLLKLVDTIDNDLIFEFSDILEKPAYALETYRKMMILPLAKNENENSVRLEKWFKEVVDDIRDMEVVRFSEALTELEDVQVRRGGEGDYRLCEKKLSGGIPKEVRSFLKSFLDTILMIYRQLANKNLKEIIKLLAWVSKNDELVQAPLQRPDSEKLLKQICLGEQDQTSALTEEDLTKINATNYQMVQKVEELADSLRKKYFAYLEKNPLRALNGLKQTRNNYKDVMVKKHGAHKKVLEPWAGIFDALIELLDKYMEQKLHVRVIPCKRTDTYDPDWHSPVGPVEADVELSANQIKSVDEDGYLYQHNDEPQLVKACQVTVVG